MYDILISLLLTPVVIPYVFVSALISLSSKTIELGATNSISNLVSTSVLAVSKSCVPSLSLEFTAAVTILSVLFHDLYTVSANGLELYNTFGSIAAPELFLFKLALNRFSVELSPFTGLIVGASPFTPGTTSYGIKITLSPFIKPCNLFAACSPELSINFN